MCSADFAHMDMMMCGLGDHEDYLLFFQLRWAKVKPTCVTEKVLTVFSACFPWALSQNVTHVVEIYFGSTLSNYTSLVQVNTGNSA